MAQSRVTQASRGVTGLARIVGAARRHFFAHGFHNVSMDDLAGEVGMSKKTLYLHFATKEALLEAVIANKFDELKTRLDAIATDSSGDVVRGLRELLEGIEREVAEIQPAFVRDIQRDAPHIFDLIARRRADAFERCFRVVFTRGRKAGLIRTNVSIKTAIAVLLGATTALMNPSKLMELGLTPRAAYSAVVSIFLKGVMTPKGRQSL